MTTFRSVHDVPDVPVPTGFSADAWADLTDQPFRTLWGPQLVIGDGVAVVRVSLMQYPDGTLETDDDESPAIHIQFAGTGASPAAKPVSLPAPSSLRAMRRIGR